MLKIVKQEINNTIKALFDIDNIDFNVSYIDPKQKALFDADVSSNICMVLSKELKQNPEIISKKIIEDLYKKIEQKESLDNKNAFEKIEFKSPGFINFKFTKDLLKYNFKKDVKDVISDIKNQDILKLKDQVVLVEYTDPNPFKVFHIGHLMPNIIGESLAGIYEVAGADVKRINYQGDVGRHVAISVFAILKEENKKVFDEIKNNKEMNLKQKVVWLGEMYTKGYNYFKDAEENNNSEIINEVARINKCIYEKSDIIINEIYYTGKEWSMEHFETMYKILGTKFDKYIMESEAAPIGVDLVRKNIKPNGKSIFEFGEEGAVIFNGENEKDNVLHSRVFINKNGLPTYEAKDLGNMNIKLNYYPETKESVVVTGNEVNDYFKVINHCVENIYPELKNKLKHFGHGMMRFPEGKISSRKGNVIAGDSLIEDIKQELTLKFSNTRLSPQEKDFVIEKVAVSAIKYTILKQSIGKDFIFDLEKVINTEGDSGPYLEYTHARLSAVAKDKFVSSEVNDLNREIFVLVNKYEDMLFESISEIAPHKLMSYLTELSREANAWYSKNRVSENEENEYIAHKIKEVIKSGLNVLGIYAPERM